MDAIKEQNKVYLVIFQSFWTIFLGLSVTVVNYSLARGAGAFDSIHIFLFIAMAFFAVVSMIVVAIIDSNVKRLKFS